MCEKTYDWEVESIILILALVLSSFFSKLSLSWKFELTTFSFSLSKVSSFFNKWEKTVIRVVFLSVSTFWIVNCTKTRHFQIFISFSFCYYLYSLSSRPPPASLLFLIVLHNGVKNQSREKGVIYDVYRNEELLFLVA